ncbi:MAG: restriction endonuclease subunit S [Candidatus Symbiothrix sp.]|jgi:type I restriction enzyme S subunit|nr:restriction endonuclease subunit S [Candidatus Symbiothrix sp.]
MIQNNNIPQGYKDSSLGIIPEEWEVKRLGEICKVNQGLQIPISERLKKYEPNSYKYITIQYLNNAKEEEYIKNPNKSVICSYEDVLMTRTGNTGIVIHDVEGVFHNNFFKIDYNRKFANKLFLIEFLRQRKTQHLILIKAGASTIPDLNHKDFYSICILLPPLPEQQKIAEILTVWDNAIDIQTRLIASLQKRKRGLMQQLLTGKKRVHQFHELTRKEISENSCNSWTEWETVELGDILDYEQPTPYLVSSTLYNDKYTIPVLTAGKTFILGYTDEINGVYENIPVIIFDDFTTDTKFVDFPFKAKSSAMKILKTKENVNIIYVYAAMQQIKYAIGGHERHWISKYAYLTIPLPPLAEQTAIANIFSSADKEIDLGKKKLASLKAQKKGLMQQLLTGKKRVHQFHELTRKEISENSCNSWIKK